jgi:tripartite-type tricarboxylate transporter receptor subunit TctC
MQDPNRHGSRTALVAKVALAACLACFGTIALAQQFPSHPVTIIVPFPAGGGADMFARAIAPKLAAEFGKPMIVENRTGATGNIGAEAVARSAPDGHTILYTSSSIALSTLAHTNSTFDPLRDLEPITMTARIPYVLVVHPSVAAHSVGELIALAREKPSALNFSSGGPGSSLHLPMELLRLKTGIDINHVPYRGASPAQLAVIAGEVQMAFLVPPLVLAHVRAGRMRALAVSSATRSPLLPDLPTLQEAGVPGYEAMQWHGVFAPAKTPAPILATLYAAIDRALDAPDMKDRFAAEGADKVSSAPAEFARALRADIDRWADVARRAKLTLQ